jgi:late competence protein required for DNA uptake (superfamily II DNA/RNA helicase)
MYGQFKITIEAEDVKTKTKVTARRQFKIPESRWTPDEKKKLKQEKLDAAQKMMIEQISHMTKPVLEAYFENMALGSDVK